MRRRTLWWTLAVLFVVVPVVEIYFLVQIGQVIGAWWTIALLIADGILGSYLVKHEGSRAWRALQEALSTYRMPSKELADGALILVGGTLLLAPGFITDVFGFFLVLPFTRPVARRILAHVIARKLRNGGSGGSSGGPWYGGPGPDGDDPRTRRRPGPESVVQGEVVD
jgi:UPF0716 protein FxsA